MAIYYEVGSHTEIQLHKLVKTSLIEKSLKYALCTGNWNLKRAPTQSEKRKGVAQVLSRMTYAATLSHLRRINTPMENKSGKLIRPRQLHSSHFGFICPAETPEGQPVPHIEVLGTSMGGILAMYLAHDPHNHIRGLFFNDIGLDLPWLSIYGLYDGMKQAGRLPTPEEMAAQFNVSIGAVLAVQSPTHFDLPYRKDWKGMKFGHLISGFKGPVRLMHGSASGVCTAQQVKDLRREFPKAQVLDVAGAAHPVPFNAAVNQFVLQSLNLPQASAVPTTPIDIPTEPLKAVAQQATPLPPAPEERVGLLGFLKQLLGATKK